MEIKINTNIGVLLFETPTKIYPGTLIDQIKCHHCEEDLDGHLYLTNKNKYTYKIKCKNCSFMEVG